jgi:hypothetical protein
VQHNGNTVNRVQQGLQQVVSWSAGMDVNCTPTDQISFSAGYVHESNFQKQRSSVRNSLDPSLSTPTSSPTGPSVSGIPIFLGIDQKNYWAQIVGVTLRYKFE